MSIDWFTGENTDTAPSPGDPAERVGQYLKPDPPSTLTGSPVREFVGSGWGQALIPLAHAAAGYLQRVPGPFGTRQRAGIGGAITGGLGGLDTVMTAQDSIARLNMLRSQMGALSPQIDALSKPTPQPPKEVLPGPQANDLFGTLARMDPDAETVAPGPVMAPQPATPSAISPRVGAILKARLAGGDVSGVSGDLTKFLTREPKTAVLRPGGGLAVETGPASGQYQIGPQMPGAERETEAAKEQRRQRAEQIAGLATIPREQKRANIAALGLDPDKFLTPSREIKIQELVEPSGKRFQVATDQEGNEIWRKAMGVHPNTIERTTKNFRDRLTLRSQGKQTGDPDVDGLTADQASKALGNLRGREDTPLRGSTNEAIRAMSTAAAAPGYDAADERGKKQMLEETANRFGFTVVGDVPLKKSKFGFGSYDLSGLSLAPMQRTTPTGAPPGAPPAAAAGGGQPTRAPGAAPTLDSVKKKFNLN